MAADAEVGFCRPEMGSEQLPGTAKATFQRHVFLVWGKASEWPENAPSDCPEGSLPKLLEAALCGEGKAKEGKGKEGKESKDGKDGKEGKDGKDGKEGKDGKDGKEGKEAKGKGKPKVKFNLIEAGEGDREGDVLIFPDYKRFRLGRGEPGPALEALKAFLKSEPASGSQLPGSDLEDLGGRFAFICAHAQRDARCAHCGPLLAEAFEAQRKAGDHRDWQVRLSSHVGGHKYAGNLVVYSGKGTQDDGHWYGYVTPQNMAEVLRGRFVRGRLWRGRLGLSEEQAACEYKAQLRRDRLCLTAMALSAAAVAAAAAYHFGRRAGRR